MKRDVLETLVRDGTRPWVRALDLAGQEEMLIDPSSDDTALGLAARAAARADASAEAEVEGRIWFLEVHNPPLELVLVGAVHIAQPLAAMAGTTSLTMDSYCRRASRQDAQIARCSRNRLWSSSVRSPEVEAAQSSRNSSWGPV